MLITYLTIHDPDGPGVPDTDGRSRAKDAGPVVSSIVETGGRVAAVKADLPMIQRLA